VVYVGGDTTFNESFATAVEREGVRRWLAAHGDPATRHAYAEFSQRRSEFIALLLKTRRALEEVYGSRASDSVKRENKRRILEQLRADYAELRAAWSGFKGYDRFFSGELTNAHLASVGAYNDLVPAFEALLAQSGGDLARFYNRVRELAERPRPERDVALQGLMAGQ
jgi:predicted aminopeptidase